jgi:hypothetical protein
MRYMDGADGTSVTMRRVYSVANAGNQVKIKGNSLIENSVLVGHCTYFRGKYNMVDGDLCRAYGSTLLLILTGNDTATVRHNTIAGEGDAQIAYGEGASSDRVYVQNNVVVGFPYYRSTSSQTLMAGGSAPAAKSFSGNMGWKVASCPSGTTCSQDPKLTNMTLASFDAEPLSGSPVVDKAPMISAVTTDFLLGKRPTGAANDVGAYEFGAGAPAPTPTPTPDPSPTPSCTRAAPTLTISGSTTPKTPGARNPYTVRVKNNDSSGCSNTKFALARTVPSGWLGSLSATSITLAPGASGSATLTVTSTKKSATGPYAIAVGTSSTVGSIHTRSASSTYYVGSGGLTETLTTSKSTYVGGETVTLSARVLRYGKPVSGAQVVFNALKPNKVNRVILEATTNAEGWASRSFTSGTGSSSIGTYVLTAKATSGTKFVEESKTFTVTSPN